MFVIKRETLLQAAPYLSITMFGLFKKKSPKHKLQAQYDKLMKQAFELSRTDRTAGDAKYAEAEEIMKKLEAFSD